MRPVCNRPAVRPSVRPAKGKKDMRRIIELLRGLSASVDIAVRVNWVYLRAARADFRPTIFSALEGTNEILLNKNFKNQ